MSSPSPGCWPRPAPPFASRSSPGCETWRTLDAERREALLRSVDRFRDADLHPARLGDPRGAPAALRALRPAHIDRPHRGRTDAQRHRAFLGPARTLGHPRPAAAAQRALHGPGPGSEGTHRAGRPALDRRPARTAGRRRGSGPRGGHRARGVRLPRDRPAASRSPRAHRARQGQPPTSGRRSNA